MFWNILIKTLRLRLIFLFLSLEMVCVCLWMELFRWNYTNMQMIVSLRYMGSKIKCLFHSEILSNNLYVETTTNFSWHVSVTTVYANILLLSVYFKWSNDTWTWNLNAYHVYMVQGRKQTRGHFSKSVFNWIIWSSGQFGWVFHVLLWVCVCVFEFVLCISHILSESLTKIRFNIKGHLFWRKP